MPYSRAIALLCMLIVSAGLGCAPALQGPTTPSGYLFRLQSSATQLWLERTPDSLIYPSVAALVVEVQDAQGKRIDDVPVSFQVSDHDGRQDTLISPAQSITSHGIATALFQPTSIGVYFVAAQVEQASQKVVIYVNSRDLCCFCQVWPPAHTCGRAP
jgi:hypothetical protein